MTFDKRFSKYQCVVGPQRFCFVLGVAWHFWVSLSIITKEFYCETRVERHWARGSLVTKHPGREGARAAVASCPGQCGDPAA